VLTPEEKMKNLVPRLNRRDLLRFGGALLVGSRSGPAFAQSTAECSVTSKFAPELSPCPVEPLTEFYPTSPLIGGRLVDGKVTGEIFSDTEENQLPIPPLLRPLATRYQGETGSIPGFWPQPGPGANQQDSHGHTHQLWPSGPSLLPQGKMRFYKMELRVGRHHFTRLPALPIDASGNALSLTPRYVPASTIYGFARTGAGGDPMDATFPGPMINAEYGVPALVRFENHLNENPSYLDRGDFGDPHWRFLTHLHNGHTAPESDGNPFFNLHGYEPHEFSDNLYLNAPAGGDSREKQSFLWFHDHLEGYTAANVYKGLVGLYPIYDPDLDPGDETSGGENGNALRLPGRRTNNDDGSFQVKYDIPLAFFDCALDDGDTVHQDFHNGCGERRPHWWGQTFFRHFPDRGFVGDVFTVNGKAFPVLHVKRRKYRFRVLDASVARVYKFRLMRSTSGPKAAPGVQGQYVVPDAEQCMQFTQIASEGGLLDKTLVRSSFELWPSKRKEFVVDFTRYMDSAGSPTRSGDVVYLVNTAKMEDGRKLADDDDRNSYVPVLKIIIDGDPPETDISDPALSPNIARTRPKLLRPLPDIMYDAPRREFLLERGGTSGSFFKDAGFKALSREFEWQINGRPFHPCEAVAAPQQNRPEIWTIRNDGGGWIHPMHFHQEEHRILAKNGVKFTQVTPSAADDAFAKEDTIALGPDEEVVIYRNFRTFPAAGFPEAKYVAHCHNLAHEDHSMLFGWKIVPKSQT
jgi:FtsP/CotA-like multicopper oxidase with cupredoxin domain